MAVNAFTPPEEPKAKDQNAFMQPQGPMMAGYPGMYGPAPMGYPMPMNPMMAQQMMNQMAAMQMAQAQASSNQGNPNFPVNVPRNYQGPMPPSPIVMPQSTCRASPSGG